MPKLMPKSRKTKPYLSIVVPVYNEAKRIKNLVKIYNFFSDKDFSSELILINDGSSDNTLEIIYQLVRNLSSKKIRIAIISYKRNRGKGYAIKKGMLTATGKYRLFMDIDLSTSLSTFNKFEKVLEKYDVVIGSRKMRGARLETRQPLLRESLGKFFTRLSQIMLQVSFSDFTCGYKLFSEDAANKAFAKQKLERWGFDSEVLFLLTRMGYKIKEVPVKWKNHPDSKVKFPQDIINSFIELLKIRYYHR